MAPGQSELSVQEDPFCCPPMHLLVAQSVSDEHGTDDAVLQVPVGSTGLGEGLEDSDGVNEGVDVGTGVLTVPQTFGGANCPHASQHG